jgi:ATP-dependent RNA helicase DDX24/MAK5
MTSKKTTKETTPTSTSTGTDTDTKKSKSFFFSPDSGSSALAWKPVNVGLLEGNENDNGNDKETDHASPRPDSSENENGKHDAMNETQLKQNNHYDNPKLIRNASKDLPVRPGEDVAFFYGLEVLENYTSTSITTSTSTNKYTNQASIDAAASPVVASTEKDTTKVSDSAAGTKTKTKTKESKKKKKKKNKKTAASRENDPHDQEQEQNQIQGKLPQHAVESSPADAKGTKSEEPKKKKQKTKPEHDASVSSRSSVAANEASSSQDKEDVAKMTVISQDKLWEVSTSWSQATAGAVLHPHLIESLAKMGFDHPTPIQAATLSGAIMGRRNLVGAAPTGSGKTLAFLLPILQAVLEQRQEQPAHTTNATATVQAVIVTPTRELATQIHSECDKLVPNQCVSLVGGIALVKQKRLLLQKKPPILIGTPGRLWATVRAFSTNDYPTI